MDLLQENWGVDHIHDLEKINEDLCVQSIWVRLEYITFLSQVNPLGTVVLWKLKKLPTSCILKLEILNLSLGSDTLIGQGSSGMASVVLLSGWYWFVRAPLRNGDMASLCNALSLPLSFIQLMDT